MTMAEVNGTCTIQSQLHDRKVFQLKLGIQRLLVELVHRPPLANMSLTDLNLVLGNLLGKAEQRVNIRTASLRLRNLPFDTGKRFLSLDIL